MVIDNNIQVSSFPARLHVILARDSAQAIVIRRGPVKQVAVIGWDRKRDEFTLGQWFKGHIYAYHSDLSADGQHFIYFAKDSRLRQTWTAVSKAPYLKALDFYKKKIIGLLVADYSFLIKPIF